MFYLIPLFSLYLIYGTYRGLYRNAIFVVVDPCDDSPCFIYHLNSSWVAPCNQTSPGAFECGECPPGMTGDGIGPQGCQGQ